MPKAKTKTAKTMSVSDVMKLINTHYKEPVLKKASDPIFRIERIPCGILSIDKVLGGGFARNRHFELFGGYGVGKTYTTYRLIANAQRLGLSCAFIDVERTFDPVFAALAGVDLDELIIPDGVEHGNRFIDLIQAMLKSGVFDVIVVDSIAAMLPKDEAEKSMEEGSYGTSQAKMMSAALRRLTTCNKRTCLVWINQTRDSLGSVFQKRSVTSGGKAMGFYAGTRIEMVRVENVKRKKDHIDPSKGTLSKKDSVIGHRVLVRIEKDKTGGAKQQDQTTFVFDYEQGGVDHIEDLIYLGRVCGLVGKSGTKWWVVGYEDEASVGRPRFKKWLGKNKLVADELEIDIAAYDLTQEESDEELDEEEDEED